MTEIIFKCAVIALCGAGIGAVIVWRIMYRPNPMTAAEARKKADELYNKLLREVEA